MIIEVTKMNLRHLQFFVVLAQTEHMAKAAEKLGISQPSLSYAISSIEEELGVPLFEKSGRNIKLTNYGAIYLQYVQNSLNELNSGAEYISELLDINRGHVNLGYTFTLGQDLVPRLVHEFKKEEQTKNINFSFNQNTTDILIKSLLNDELDIVLASMPQKQDIKDKINTFHLVDQEILAAVPFENPLAKYSSVSLQELVQYPFIYYSQNSGLRPQLDRMFAQAHVKPNITIESIEDHTIVGFVHWNYGVAVIPNLPQLDPHEMKLLHLKDKVGLHPIYIITKADHFLTPAVNRFSEFAQRYCYKNYVSQNKLI